MILTRKPIGNATNHQNYNMQNDGSNSGYQQQWGYGQGWEQNQQQQQQTSVSVNPTTGQPDYSQQWIEYYKSLGMHREAEMIEQQLKAKQASQMPPNGSTLTHNQAMVGAQMQVAGQTNQTTDYSAQWAEYYRSIGKIEEAEAIEKQMAAQKAVTSGQVGQGGQAQTGQPNVTQNSGGTVSQPTYPQAGMTQGGMQSAAAASYAQYSQYYAAAAAAGQSGYAQAYGAYGPYSGAPQIPPQQSQQQQQQQQSSQSNQQSQHNQQNDKN